MFTDKSTTKLYVKLNKETAENSIKWKAIDAPNNITDGSNDLIDTIFTLNYKGKNLAIYQKKYKYYFDEDRWTWDEGIEFSLLTDDYKPLWKSSGHSQALRDLFETVTRQASGLDELIQELLD
ncbi:hypothetical protein EQG67_07240 [Kosakonia cowanii]|uniref:hypothetical protein n=1 Tax=Kosakonia cowanii TaxID=208223 RepID=UPI000FECC826|nr:hypothetical protein [Kosakonia cowanii]QAR45565.1 hypothetical protein EQG67_07240 [Kosakonia cowanii]